nr:hypothetical protein [Nonomuraea harbinensis]
MSRPCGVSSGGGRHVPVASASDRWWRSSRRGGRLDDVVRDAHQRSRVPGLLVRLGDDQGHRLSRVVHDGVLHREEALAGRGQARQRRQQARRRGDPRQVLVGEDGEDALRRVRRAGVHRGHPAGGDGRADDREMRRPRRRDLR